MKSVKTSRAEQYLHDTLTWERALDFYKQENAFLKTRLSQILDNNTGKDFVEMAEHFNNRFVFTDDYIASLMQDLWQQKSMLQAAVKGLPANDKLINKYQQKLQAEMEGFEKGIAELKREFNRQVVSYMRIS